MTNASNEFVQQLESLFHELHTVLQRSLANTVTKEEYEKLNKRIESISKRIKDVQNSAEKFEQRMTDLDEKLNRMQQQLNEISKPDPMNLPPTQEKAPDAGPQNGTPERPPTDQYGLPIDNNKITLTPGHLAGRDYQIKNQKTNTKTEWKRQPFPVIESPELLKRITSSTYYHQSIHESTDGLAQHTKTLITETTDRETALLHALQLCILIDLTNMHLLGYKDNDLYEPHTKIMQAQGENQGVIDFISILEGYGLKKDEQKYDINLLKNAIEKLAYLSEDDTKKRINKDSYLLGTGTGKQNNRFVLFQNKLKQVINNNKTAPTNKAQSDQTSNQSS